MLNSVRNKLILLYTCSTGLILTFFLILVFLYTNRQMNIRLHNSFQNNILTINQSVQIANSISDLWLAEMEVNNKLIIYIEENGVPLQFQGSWVTPTDRSILIEKIRELAFRDRINPKIRPITTAEISSRVYEFKGNRNDSYLGEISILPTQDGYRSIIVIQYISDNKTDRINQKLNIALLDFVGIVFLFILSRWLMGKSLKPVEESRRRQTEFIAAVSHELKSPLSVIRANSSAIMLEPGRAEHFTKGIDKECARLAVLIEDMLLLVNADARTWKIKNELIDMETVLIDTYDTFAPFCMENGKQLKLELQENILPKIQGDLLRLKQILAVLLDNAVSYSKVGDSIILRAYVKKNHIWVEVEDHGVGIENSKKSEVFERFYREDKSRKNKNHYGLGLSIAKELVELHSGTISIRDTVGGGATFYFRLPIPRAEASMEKA